MGNVLSLLPYLPLPPPPPPPPSHQNPKLQEYRLCKGYNWVKYMFLSLSFKMYHDKFASARL